MSLSARDQEALERIADGITSSDSNLARLLDTFTRLTLGEEMPEGEEVKQAGPRARRRKRRPHTGFAPRMPWLPAALVLIVTAVIVMTVTLAGGGKAGSCGHLRGMTCVSQVSANPSAQHSG